MFLYLDINYCPESNLFCNSNGSKFLSVNRTLTCKNSDSNVSKDINIDGKTSIKLSNGFLGVDVCKTLESLRNVLQFAVD